MAYQRLSDNKVLGDGLDAFVQNTLTNYTRQLGIRNAEDEARFNRLVLESDLPLEGQLTYRKEQLNRVSDDPEEKRRVEKEISSLKDRMQQKEYSDAYLDKLIDLESGHASVESVVQFLRGRLATATDENVKASIRKSLQEQEGNLFGLKESVLKAQNEYAIQNKRVDMLDEQIGRVSEARAQAVLANDAQRSDLYDLQLAALRKAKNEASIEDAVTAFSVGSMSGYQNATGLLDAYNSRISSAGADGPVTIGGVRYDSPKQFWTFKRDSYLSDDSASGFFPRMSDEAKTALSVKRSSNALTDRDVAEAKAGFDALAARTELANFAQKINTYRQDVIQNGVDLRARDIANAYDADLDVNKAFRSLQNLKDIGGNVSSTEGDILSKAAQLKEAQVGNILQTAQDLMKQDPSLTPEAAIQKAAETGAAIVLSPTQLVQKTESQIATEQANAAAGGKVQDEPRTTAGAEPTKAATVGAPPVAPTTQDLSERYGLVGKTVYDKQTGQAFTSEKSFFDQAGVNSFQNLKFDTGYVPPASGASPELQAQAPSASSPSAPAPAASPAPTPAPGAPAPTASPSTTYKVRSGDTLSGIAQSLLGDASRSKEIAMANKIADPNRINVDQELIIPKR